ncbi:hypothetical protein J6590_100691, partial [Homalodisca vitripennis]
RGGCSFFVIRLLALSRPLAPFLTEDWKRVSSVSCTCTECTVSSDRRAENCALSTEVIEPDLSCSDEYTEPAPQWSSMH